MKKKEEKKINKENSNKLGIFLTMLSSVIIVIIIYLLLKNNLDDSKKIYNLLFMSIIYIYLYLTNCNLFKLYSIFNIKNKIMYIIFNISIIILIITIWHWILSIYTLPNIKYIVIISIVLLIDIVSFIVVNRNIFEKK